MSTVIPFRSEPKSITSLLLKTSAKASSQQSAWKVTKEYSVVSNRAGIRERSVFWVSRGAGRQQRSRAWLVAANGRRVLLDIVQLEAAARLPRPLSRLLLFPVSVYAARAIESRMFLRSSAAHIEKINGHFGLRASRRVAGSGRGSNTFIYLVAIVVGRDMAR